MRSSTRSLGSILGCAVLLVALSVQAQDWPQWRGPNRDGKATSFSAPATWPKALAQKWKVTVGTGAATPAMVDGRIYVFARQGGDEVTLCLDAVNGQELWRDTNAVAAISGPSSRQHGGPRSSPAVADGRVITLGVSGVLTCLDAATGKVQWRKEDFKAVPRFYTASSPMVADGLCIAQLGGPDNGGVVAFDLVTGSPRWQWLGEGPDYSSPVLLTADGVKQVVAMTLKSVIGISLADGKLLWQVPFVAQGRNYNAATPIVDGQRVIFSGQGRGTKAIEVQKQGDGFVAKELWSNPEIAVQFSNPVLKDQMLYGISDKGNIFCLDAQSGQIVWTDATRRGNYGPMVDAGSAILTLTEKGELIAFRPGEKQYAELSSIKVSTSTYAYPIAAGTAIYIKDQDALTMWTFE